MKIQDRYEYEPTTDLLGRGGFARVYRARDTLLHRDVALKVFSDTGGQRGSVLDEIRKVIGLEHPNLLRYYDVVLLETENHLGEKEQTQIGIMELANAGDLKQFARANPGSPLLFKLLKDVLQGLEYLHLNGIIHRDIKAQNVLLVEKNGQLTAKISDFGISKDTGAGGNNSSMMMGTIEYMAPEQFAPAKYGIDGKIASNLDLWSFGIMVHELLTDTTPFGNRDGDTTVEQILAQILATELPQDIERLPEPYRSVVRKCLVTNARERIRKASELLGYFDGPVATAPAAPASDGETKVYPKGGPAVQAPRDDDATKVYPKSGLSAQAPPRDDDATKVYGDAPKTPEPVAQSMQAGQGEPGRPKRKGVLMAAITGLVLVAGVGGWAMNEHQARLQAEAKAAVELAAAAEAKAAAAAKVAGQTFRDCAECPEMVVLPAGSFDMGSNEEWAKTSADGLASVTPVHRVNVLTFSIGKTEVTQAQWQMVMGGNPSDFQGCNDCPVEQVSWDDIQGFLQKLNVKTGKQYRLPSEAEWEYACRAGGKYDFCGSNEVDAVGWTKRISGKKTHPAGQKQANAFGLYDMTGNVFEWTEDCWNENYKGAPTDGRARKSGNCDLRSMRGGAYFFNRQDSRPAIRARLGTTDRYNFIGFRLARTLP
jgi:formylglycine-generating enzyme required for sulfatase activity/serine/threonine protein kinase